jgi:hydroxyacylglutathione hydrolase
MHAWETAGYEYDRIPAVHTRTLVERIEAKESFTLLDVRKAEEYRERHLPDARHVYLGELPDKLDEIPRNRPVTTFCGSGKRAIIAASLLKRNGFEIVEDSLGSMQACSASGCPLVEEDKS